MRKLVQGYHIGHLVPFLQGVSSNLVAQYGDPLLLKTTQPNHNEGPGNTKISKAQDLLAKIDIWNTISSYYQP